MRSPFSKRWTDVYCQGISDAIPWPGTPDEFIEKLEEARYASEDHGENALILRWQLKSGEQVVLDLNRTKVVAMVEREVS